MGHRHGGQGARHKSGHHGHVGVKRESCEAHGDETAGLRTEQREAFGSEIVSSLGPTHVEVDEAHDNGRQADSRQRGGQLRHAIEGGQRTAKGDECGCDQESAANEDEVEKPLKSWIVSVGILNQEPVAAAVSDHVEEL